MQKIIDALAKVGIKDTQLQTESVKIEQTDPQQQRQTEGLWKERRYHVSQSLTLIVPAKSAQGVMNAAAGVGANDVGSPEWLLNDYDAAQAKAAGAALKKARLTAEQMAAGLNSKLGELVYASNQAPQPAWLRTMGTELATVEVEAAPPPPPPPMYIFPKAVEVKATVYATFAVE
jgi:uncharacterized protein YggE